jgi:hypothetical protein
MCVLLTYLRLLSKKKKEDGHVNENQAKRRGESLVELHRKALAAKPTEKEERRPFDREKVRSLGCWWASLLLSLALQDVLVRRQISRDEKDKLLQGRFFFVFASISCISGSEHAQRRKGSARTFNAARSCKTMQLSKKKNTYPCLF